MTTLHPLLTLALAAGLSAGLPATSAARASDRAPAAPATKPADGKPADGKPADGKPADGKPAAVKKLSVDEFDKARQADGAVVLDVRSPDEYAAGHVPGAVNVPVTGKGSEAFDKAVAAIDRDKPVLVHCRSGVRSAKAVAKMREMGFAHLAEFPGGWVAWEGAGKPIEQGGKKPDGPAK
jgi:phage shock protein E